MENPATWGPAEKVVHDVLREQDNILPELGFCGLSLERQITDALREHGLLREDEEKSQAEEKDSRTRPYPPDPPA